LNDYVTWRRNLIFRDSAASSAINVFFDLQGGFVLADAGQQQLRAYADAVHSSTPVILWAAGRRGDGPGEFRQLRSAVRIGSDQTVALDISGRLTFFNQSGGVTHTRDTRLSPAFNVWLINDSTLLISGRTEGNLDSPLLHVWNLRRDSVVTSFFDVPPHRSAFDEAYRLSGFASAALLGRDSVAVTFPLVDSLYVYRTDGTRLGAFKIGLAHFRPLKEPAPRNESPEARIQWRSSYTRISQVFRAPDGAILLQYYNLRGVEPTWGISRLFLDRDRLHKSFEVPEAPRLLGISPRDSSLYFLREDYLESTVWSLARFYR